MKPRLLDLFYGAASALKPVRCLLGIHRLRGYHGDYGPYVASIDPRGRPGPGDWRKCEWCGASWRGAYDGIEPVWVRNAAPKSAASQGGKQE